MTTPSCSSMQVPVGVVSGVRPRGKGPAKVEPAEGKGGATLRQRAVRGSLWVVGSLLVIQLAKVFSNTALARLLNPEIFGLSALATVVATGLEMLSDLGIGQNIIQNPRGDDPRFLNTAWTIQVLRGLTVAAILAVVAIPVSWAYQDSRLAIILVMSAGTAVIGGFDSTAIDKLNRHLGVRQNCLLKIGCELLATGATIVSALVTPTIWAIIIGGYVRATVRMIVSHWLNTGMRNRFCWDAESRQAILSFGRWVFIATAVAFFAAQVDRLLLGRLETLEVLGVYNLAMTVAIMPRLFGQHLAQMVLYPLFAHQARADLSQLEGKVLRGRRVVISALLCCILAAILGSPWFFGLLYDARYADAGWLAQILCLYTWFWGLQITGVRALLAVGQTRPLSLANGINLAVTIVGSIAGHWIAGLPGFAVGICLSSLAGHLAVQAALARQGIHILRQDAVYTLSLLLLAALGAGGPRLVAGLSGGPMSLGVSLALGILTLALASGWLLRVLVKEVLARRVAAE